MDKEHAWLAQNLARDRERELNDKEASRPSIGPRFDAAGARDALEGALLLGGTHGSLAVARSLGRRGIPVWLIETSRSIASFSRYVERRFTWAGPEAPGALDWLINLADRRGLKRWLLLPAIDPETRFIAENHESLSRRFQLATMPWSILKFAQDKNLLYQRAASLGVAFPKSYLPEADTGILNLDRFPVVIRPTMREDNNPLSVAKAW